MEYDAVVFVYFVKDVMYNIILHSASASMADIIFVDLIMNRRVGVHNINVPYSLIFPIRSHYIIRDTNDVSINTRAGVILILIYHGKYQKKNYRVFLYLFFEFDTGSAIILTT